MAELSPEAKERVQSLAATSLALDLGECSDTRYHYNYHNYEQMELCTVDTMDYQLPSGL